MKIKYDGRKELKINVDLFKLGVFIEFLLIYLNIWSSIDVSPRINTFLGIVALLLMFLGTMKVEKNDI